MLYVTCVGAFTQQTVLFSQKYFCTVENNKMAAVRKVR